MPGPGWVLPNRLQTDSSTGPPARVNGAVGAGHPVVMADTDLIAAMQGIALVSEARRRGVDDRQFRRAVRRGTAVRLHRGAYLSAESWERMDRDQRYRHRVVAAALASRSRPILCHESAAVLWGMPTLGNWPDLVHVLTTLGAGTRTENGFRRHAAVLPVSDVVESDGVQLTGLGRTLLDIARDSPFAAAVAALDWALRPPRQSDLKPWIARDEFAAYVARADFVRNRVRVNRVISFASPLAESPGETLSRVQIDQLGFPRPELQVEFRDRKGLIGRADFYWPDYNLIGEYDGRIKYTRSQYRKGRSIEEIVLAEKHREDRLRATGLRVTRWDSATAANPAELRDQLRNAGLPTRR